jgi:hypothetical protein
MTSRVRKRTVDHVLARALPFPIGIIGAMVNVPREHNLQPAAALKRDTFRRTGCRARPVDVSSC